MILVIPVVAFMLYDEFQWALILFLIAGLSDAVDGYLAKHFNWVSRLGEILDPLADKLLMVSCYLVLGWLDYLPVSLVLVVIGRDILIVVIATIFRKFIQSSNITPTNISKINTTAQILLICIVLFSISVFEISDNGLNVILYLVYLTTIASGLDYIIIWTKYFINNRHPN